MIKRKTPHIDSSYFLEKKVQEQHKQKPINKSVFLAQRGGGEEDVKALPFEGWKN